MKMKSRIGDGMFITLLIMSVLTLLFLVVWVVIGVWYPAVIMFAVLLIFVGPTYFFTNYNIDKDCLKINFGLFLINYKIDYYNIISMTDSEKFSFAPALSFHRICIRYVKNGKIKSILISPVKKDKFRELVHEKIKESMEKAKQTPDIKDQSIIQQVLEKERLAQEKYEAKMLRQQNAEAFKSEQQQLDELAERAYQAQTQKEIDEMQQAIDQANQNIDLNTLAQIETREEKVNMQNAEANALYKQNKNREKKLSKEEKKLLKQQQSLINKKEQEQIKLEQQSAKAEQDALLKEQKEKENQLKEAESKKRKEAKASIKKQKDIEKSVKEQEKKLNLNEENLKNLFDNNNKQ